MFHQQPLQLRHIGGQGVDIEHALIIRESASVCARDWLCLQHFASYFPIAVFWLLLPRSLHAARVGTMRSGSIGASVVRLARRQSIPSSNIDSSALLKAIVPVAVCGHTKRPPSSRFDNRFIPSPLYHKIFKRLPRRPRKTNRWPA